MAEDGSGEDRFIGAKADIDELARGGGGDIEGDLADEEFDESIARDD
jgi:hypothetical protein